LTGYILQTIAMASFGVSNCLWQQPLKTIPIFLLIAIRAGLNALLFSLLILSYKVFDIELLDILFTSYNFNINTITTAVGICCINYFGLYFFNKSIKHGSTGISIPLLCLGTLIGIAIGIFLYNEEMTVVKVVIALIFILGVWFMEKLNNNVWKLKFSKGVGFGLLANLFWSSGFIFPILIQSLGVLFFSLILEIVVCCMSITGYLIQHRKNINPMQYPIKQNFKWIGGLVVFGSIGVLFSQFSTLFLPIHVLGMLGIIQPIVSVIIACILIKEKLTLPQYIGIFLMLLGMWVSINMSSN